MAFFDVAPRPGRPDIDMRPPCHPGARSVKTWLVARQAVPATTPIKGHGKSRPVASNTKPDGSDNPQGRQKNRRVEIVIDTCR